MRIIVSVSYLFTATAIIFGRLRFVWFISRNFMAALILPLTLVICTIIYKWQINVNVSVAKL